MAKLKYVFILTFVLLLVYLSFHLKNSRQLIAYSINGKTYHLLVARKRSEQQKGLMFYRSKKELKGADGMIFIFDDKDFRTFWNKNTFLDLDVYWIDGEKIVGKDYLPSIKKTKEIFKITSSRPVDKVVEIVR